MRKPDPQQVTDLFFEAALVPECWSRALDALTTFADGAFASMLAIPPDVSFAGDNQKLREVRLLGTPEAERLLTDLAALGPAVPTNTRMLRALERAKSGLMREFQQDFDWLSAEEVERDPFYLDIMRPRGYGWCAGTVVDMPTGDRLVFSVERAYRRGAFDSADISALNGLWPDLARAGMLAARLGLERVRGAVDALGQVGLPAGAVRHDGRLLTANPAFDQLVPAYLQDSARGLRTAGARSDALLARALAELRAGGSRSGVVGSFPCLPVDGRPPIILHVLPLVGVGRDIITTALALIVATGASSPAVPSDSVLRALFDLTPAEARLAQALASGHALADYASTTGVAVTTVRAQLRAVLAKTGVHRQVDLVRLLAGLGGFIAK